MKAKQLIEATTEDAQLLTWNKKKSKEQADTEKWNEGHKAGKAGQVSFAITRRLARDPLYAQGYHVGENDRIAKS